MHVRHTHLIQNLPSHILHHSSHSLWCSLCSLWWIATKFIKNFLVPCSLQHHINFMLWCNYACMISQTHCTPNTVYWLIWLWFVAFGIPFMWQLCSCHWTKEACKLCPDSVAITVSESGWVAVTPVPVPFTRLQKPTHACCKSSIPVAITGLLQTLYNVSLERSECTHHGMMEHIKLSRDGLGVTQVPFKWL